MMCESILSSILRRTFFILSIRHNRGWQFKPPVLFVLVLSETGLVLEDSYLDFVDKRARYLGSSFL
jgi:hypothetical protein